MNSLFKLYLRNTVIAFLVGVFFSFLFVYLSCNNFIESTLTGYYSDTWGISHIFSEFTSSCFLMNICLEAILIYTFYMYRNKKTGIFIRQLPIKSDKEFLLKVFLLLALILFLTSVQLIIFNLLTNNFISENYNVINDFYASQNTVIKSLGEIYREYYSNFLELTMINIFISSLLIFFSQTLGIMGFAITMPVILLFSFMGCLVGLNAFLLSFNIKLEFHFLNYLSRSLNRMFRIVFENDSKLPYYITMTVSSLLLYIVSYFCSIKINYSKVGQLFLFKWIKVLTYITGILFGGFSFYFLGYSILLNLTPFTSVVMLIVSFIISYLIIRKIEQIFI